MARLARIRAYSMAPANPKGLAVFTPALSGRGEGRTTDGKLIPYGIGNALPQQWNDLCMQSGTAYACLERRKAILEGMGLPLPVGAIPVPGTPHTYADLWSQLCSYGGGFRGVALLVRYNAAGELGEIHLLPFGAVRKTTAGTFLFNQHFGRDNYRETETTEHEPFDPAPDVVDALLSKAGKKKPNGKDRIGQPGQILYAYAPQAGEEDYPLPVGNAGRQDIATDTEYAKFDLEEVRNGFFPNTIITLIGKRNNKTADENNETEDDRTDDELKEFTGNGTNPNGRKKIVVMDAETRELAPVISSFDGGSNLEKLIAKRPAIAEAVCRHMGIMPILIGLSTAGKLGQSQEIMNAVELTQDMLTPLREMLLRVLRRLLPGQVITVANKKPISFLPPEVYKTLTPLEIRKLGGYPESTQNDTLEVLNSMAPHVATAVMAAMTPTQLLALVGLPAPTTAPAPAPLTPVPPTPAP